jgi:nucleotide-binding universal stress UspA family protein
VHSVVSVAEPAREIARQAQKHRAALVVMGRALRDTFLGSTSERDLKQSQILVLGTHGRTGVAHALLGTVAGDVFRDAPCDILVVPPRKDRAQRGN